MRGLRMKQSKLEAKASILEHQADVLTKYSVSMTGEFKQVDQLEAYLGLYRSQKAQIDEEKFELNEALEKLETEIKERRKKMNADEESVRKRGVHISIVALAEGPGEAELSLIYMVRGASWTPQYDLRATVSQDEKTPSCIDLHYRASVLQTTGEDWAGVRLCLSTATPIRGSDIPSLEPIWIRETEHSLPRKSLASKAARRTTAVAMQTRTAQLEEGVLSSTFVIPGLSTIPSESETYDKQKTHSVSIAEVHLSSVDLEWITVPKFDPSAFLRCKVKNTSEYPLLSGNSSVFLNGSFVTKSSIPNVSPQEKFGCSLGVDPAIRVTYHPQSKKKRRTGSLLNAKTNITSFERKITVTNTRTSRVPRLRISEQIPTSESEKIKVNLLEPNGSDMSRGKLGDDIQVQWKKPSEESASNDESEHSGEVGVNEFEWICNLGPGKSSTVTLAWEVVAPIGVDWHEVSEGD